MTEEIQSEELEVLRSIYDGESAFVVLAPNHFQYKFGEDSSPKSFILDVLWTRNYPEELPEISMNAFYNKHVIQTVKDSIVKSVLDVAEENLGMSMTYTLFEHVKEQFDNLLAAQPVDVITDLTEKLKSSQIENETEEKTENKSSTKKVQLTKAQKKRMWAKGGLTTEDRPRGWNWVDIIRHLSQSGFKEE